MTTTTRPAASVWRRAGRFAKRVLMLELRIYANIARFVARRPAIPRGAAGFGFHKPVLTILIVFIVLSAVEIPIVDLIVHPWPAVRIALLVVGIWGVTWMIGLLCAYVMRPHTVGPDGIRLRGGLETDIAFSWDDIASVARNRAHRPAQGAEVRRGRWLSHAHAAHQRRDRHRDRTRTADGRAPAGSCAVILCGERRRVVHDGSVALASTAGAVARDEVAQLASSAMRPGCFWEPAWPRLRLGSGSQSPGRCRMFERAIATASRGSAVQHGLRHREGEALHLLAGDRGRQRQGARIGDDVDECRAVVREARQSTAICELAGSSTRSAWKPIAAPMAP